MYIYIYIYTRTCVMYVSLSLSTAIYIYTYIHHTYVYMYIYIHIYMYTPNIPHSERLTAWCGRSLSRNLMPMSCFEMPLTGEGVYHARNVYDDSVHPVSNMRSASFRAQTLEHLTIAARRFQRSGAPGPLVFWKNACRDLRPNPSARRGHPAHRHPLMYTNYSIV